MVHFYLYDHVSHDKAHICVDSKKKTTICNDNFLVSLHWNCSTEMTDLVASSTLLNEQKTLVGQFPSFFESFDYIDNELQYDSFFISVQSDFFKMKRSLIMFVDWMWDVGYKEACKWQLQLEKWIEHIATGEKERKLLANRNDVSLKRKVGFGFHGRIFKFYLSRYLK